MTCGAFKILIATIQCNIVKRRKTNKGTVERPCINKYCEGCLKKRYNEDLDVLQKCTKAGVASFFTWGRPPTALYFMDSVRAFLGVRVAKAFAIARDVKKCWEMKLWGNHILTQCQSVNIHPFPAFQVPIRTFQLYRRQHKPRTNHGLSGLKPMTFLNLQRNCHSSNGHPCHLSLPGYKLRKESSSESLLLGSLI